jgi:hypothetical protein
VLVRKFFFRGLRFFFLGARTTAGTPLQKETRARAYVRAPRPFLGIKARKIEKCFSADNSIFLELRFFRIFQAKTGKKRPETPEKMPLQREKSIFLGFFAIRIISRKITVRVSAFSGIYCGHFLTCFRDSSVSAIRPEAPKRNRNAAKTWW